MVDGAPVATGTPDFAIGRRDPAGVAQPGFASWHWDGRTLTVGNCRYGARPVYYCAQPGEICVSTSIEALLARGVPMDLDVEALATFLRLNWFLAEDTPFKAIRIVPPAARFRWDGALSLDSKLHLVPANGVQRGAAIDEYIARFRRAI